MSNLHVSGHSSASPHPSCLTVEQGQLSACHMLSTPACDMLKVQDSVHTNWSKAVGVVARKNLGLFAAYACEVGRLAASTRLCPAGLEAMASPVLAQAQLAQIWTALQATASKYSVCCAIIYSGGVAVQHTAGYMFISGLRPCRLAAAWWLCQEPTSAAALFVPGASLPILRNLLKCRCGHEVVAGCRCHPRSRRRRSCGSSRPARRRWSCRAALRGEATAPPMPRDDRGAGCCAQTSTF